MYLDLCYFLLEACKKLPNHTKSDKDLVFSNLDILVLIRLLIYGFFLGIKKMIIKDTIKLMNEKFSVL